MIRIDSTTVLYDILLTFYGVYKQKVSIQKKFAQYYKEHNQNGEDKKEHPTAKFATVTNHFGCTLHCMTLFLANVVRETGIAKS